MKFKNTLLSLGTLGTITAPIATVIACGCSSSIALAITPEDLTAAISFSGINGHGEVTIADRSKDGYTIALTSGGIDGELSIGDELTFTITPAEGYSLGETESTFQVTVNGLDYRQGTLNGLETRIPIVLPSGSKLEDSITSIISKVKEHSVYEDEFDDKQRELANELLTAENANVSSEEQLVIFGNGVQQLEVEVHFEQEEFFEAKVNLNNPQVRGVQDAIHKDRTTYSSLPHDGSSYWNYELNFIKGTDTATADNIETAFLNMIAKSDSDNDNPVFIANWVNELDVNEDGEYTLEISSDGYYNVLLHVKVQ